MKQSDLDRIKRWQRRLSAYAAQRDKHKPHWQEIVKYLLSRTHGHLFEEVDQAKRGKPEIYNIVGIKALNALANGLMGGLTNPSTRWFRLSLARKDLAANEAAQGWVRACEEIFYSLLSRSNFYDQIHRAYLDLGAFGNGVILIEEAADTTVNFQALNISSYYLAVNERGIIDTLYRKLKLTAAQLMERWQDKLPPLIKSLYESDRLEVKFEVLHVLEPRREYDPGLKDGLNRPFVSAYILLDGHNVILEESGYYERPFIAARWGAGYEDTYGYGPASDVLPAAKSLQQIGKSLLKALQKTVEPPLVASSSLKSKMNQISTQPNFVIYADNNGNQPAIAPLYQLAINPAQADPQVMRYEEQVKAGLFYDLFMLFTDTGKEMTVPETEMRKVEKSMQLGPVLERFKSECFDPLFGRVWAIAGRAGMLPPPPEEIAGQELRLEFRSSLALAQRAGELANIQQALAIAGGMAQMFPAVLDKINADRVLEIMEDVLGLDPQIVRGADQVAAIRQARTEQEQQMAGQQQALAAGQMAVEGISAGAGAMKDAAAAGLPVAEMMNQVGARAGQ